LVNTSRNAGGGVSSAVQPEVIYLRVEDLIAKSLAPLLWLSGVGGYTDKLRCRHTESKVISYASFYFLKISKLKKDN
jgi:hypothetical protein